MVKEVGFLDISSRLLHSQRKPTKEFNHAQQTTHTHILRRSILFNSSDNTTDEKLMRKLHISVNSALSSSTFYLRRLESTHKKKIRLLETDKAYMQRVMCEINADPLQPLYKMQSAILAKLKIISSECENKANYSICFSAFLVAEIRKKELIVDQKLSESKAALKTVKEKTPQSYIVKLLNSLFSAQGSCGSKEKMCL